MSYFVNNKGVSKYLKKKFINFLEILHSFKGNYARKNGFTLRK